MLPRGTSPLGLQDDSGFQSQILSRNDNSGRISSDITNASVLRLHKCLGSIVYLRGCALQKHLSRSSHSQEKKGQDNDISQASLRQYAPKTLQKCTSILLVTMKVVTNIHSFTFCFEDLKIEVSSYQGDAFTIKHYRWGGSYKCR